MINDLLTGLTRCVVEIRSSHFYARPSQARAVQKRSGFVFPGKDRVTRLVCLKIQQDKNLSNFDKLRCQSNGNLKIHDFLQKLKKVVRIVSCGPAISQSDCRKAGLYQFPYNNMLLLTNCEVQIFSRMDRINWSIRALLYGHNQHLGFILDKMILNWIIMTFYTSNSFSSIFIWILQEYFPIPLSHLKRSFHSKKQNLLKTSLSSILFVYWCRPSIFLSFHLSADAQFTALPAFNAEQLVFKLMYFSWDTR